MTTSSPLPSFSSPASSRFPTARRASFSGQLAFLVHSQETVANHMPPDVDNKALARQKRRRTRYVGNGSSSVLPFRARDPCSTRAGSCSTYCRELFGLLPRGQATLQHPISADHDILQQGRRRRTKGGISEKSKARQSCTPGNCPQGRAWRKRSAGTINIAHVTSVRALANMHL